MSATTALTHQVRYKDQLKLIRAETAVAWVAVVLNRVGEAFKSEPVAVEPSKPQGYFGAFY